MQNSTPVPGASADNQPVSSFPLIGVEGSRFVSELLATKPPQVAVRTIQSQAGLQHPLCIALLGMVDQLGVARSEAHRGILTGARRALLTKVQQTQAQDDRVKLERLLAASFMYLGITELRDVPLAVMEKLEAVPPVFLKQLAIDKDIFKELPDKVKRQVWEFDKNPLQEEALPLVGRYKYETATVMRGLAADEFLGAVQAAMRASRRKAAMARSSSGTVAGMSLGPTARAAGTSGTSAGLDEDEADHDANSGFAVKKPPYRPVTRKILRKGSEVVKRLLYMIGSSTKIYRQVVELCAVKYRDANQLYTGHREASYCSLRAALLMGLHDASSPVATKDRCHQLAWTLDAGMTNGYLTDKHLAKLVEFFEELEQTEMQAADKASAARGTKNAPGYVQDEQESAGNAVIGGSGMMGGGEPGRVLGDASIILRDPSAMHLLAGAVLQRVLPGALSGTLPADIPDVTFILRLMVLGVDGRHMLRDRKYRFSEVDARLTHDLLPLLAAWVLLNEATPSPLAKDIQGSDGSDADPPGGWGVPQAAVSTVMELLPRNEVGRRLTQAFTLERIASGDWLSATRACKLLATALKPSAIQEGWDFAGALATRLADAVKAGVLDPGCCLWGWAVDKLLLVAVDAHMQVHEEVLRLLMAASQRGGLTVQRLADYCATTLENSKHSRKRLARMAAQDTASLQAMALAGELGSDVGSDIGSDGWQGIKQLKLFASSGVKSVYKKVADMPGMNEKVAPALFAYLDEGKTEEQKERDAKEREAREKRARDRAAKQKEGDGMQWQGGP